MISIIFIVQFFIFYTVIIIIDYCNLAIRNFTVKYIQYKMSKRDRYYKKS